MDAHGSELRPGLRGFRGLRVARDQVAKLVDTGIFLALLDQGKSLVQLRCRGLRISAEAFKHRVVVLIASA